MTDLTDHERRAAEAGTLRHIVRPMEEQPPARSKLTFIAHGQACFERSVVPESAEWETEIVMWFFNVPHVPGDTLPTDPPLKVVGVEAMRLVDARWVLPGLSVGVWHAEDQWRDTFEQPSNPWVWVYRVKRG
jgi:hypothetical protein